MKFSSVFTTFFHTSLVSLQNLGSKLSPKVLRMTNYQSLFLDREKHFWILKTLSKTSPFPKYFYNFIWALLFLEIRNERFMLGENIEKWPVELGANWFILGKNHELSQVFEVSATMGGWNKSQNILFAINLAPPFSLLWEKQIPLDEVFPDFSFQFSSFHF